MFCTNPFRRIKDLEFEIDVRDRVIENLKKEIEELKTLTRPKYHPNVTCVDCEYCIVKGQAHHTSMGYENYYCRLNNNCEDYTLKEQGDSVTYVR